MNADQLDASYYSPEDDNYGKAELDDTRRPRLTLKHLNRLKKMRAARNIENLVRRDTLQLLYGVPEEAAPGM
jgi:hypothetical protein